MPIYAYKCESCGFAKDVLQKVSDAPLEICPACSQAAFRKQLTAAGFQLKGSGWYVTDFRGGTNNAGANAHSQSAETTPSDAAPAASTPAASDPAPSASATTPAGES